ncbi:ketopantoate reductase C-terminal domain-containing protein [Streptomyces sp. NPDC093600]|uniref:ketopantoate reductase C-terminal domain-containing protein n=1 Tax=Streptomyces sp. NPDC093600 TaxID=3366047 RepID=UPI00381BFFEA
MDALNARFGAARVSAESRGWSPPSRRGRHRPPRAARPAHRRRTGRPPSPAWEGAGRTGRGAGIDVLVPSDVITAIWHKWVFITTFGAVTSLMRGTVGEVEAVPGGTELGPSVLADAAEVAAAAGRPVPESERAATLGVVTAAGSSMAPSLYRDRWRAAHRGRAPLRRPGEPCPRPVGGDVPPRPGHPPPARHEERIRVASGPVRRH